MIKKKIRKTGLYVFLGLLLSGSSILGTSCRPDKKSVPDEDSVRIAQSIKQKQEIFRMGGYEYVDSILENGHRYEYRISRQPADSSALVVEEEGFKSVDNVITLDVKRDGAPFFSRRLTRTAFQIDVDRNYFQQCILLNLVYDKPTETGLRFIASIGKGSDDDDYVQYAFILGYDGSTNIVHHEFFDEDEIDRMSDEDGV